MIQIRQSVFETNSSSTHSLVYKSKNPSEIDKHKIPDYYLNDDWTWNINFGQYHWTNEVPLKRWHEKLNYLMTIIAFKLLCNFKDPNYVLAEDESDYHANYLWNSYEDENAQQRWDEACKILDKSVEVQELKALVAKHCECKFEGFNYCWWDANKISRYAVEDVFENELNTINHPFWHDSEYEDKYGYHQPEGCEAFSKFGSIDHQSMEDSLYDLIKEIGFETYLFSSDIMIIIDHDNH
jgi:hypothetical protein